MFANRNWVGWLPWGVLLIYCIEIYATYAPHLDGTLAYRRSAIAVAPEDVLGLGFWPTWLVGLALLLCVVGVTYWLDPKRNSNLAAALAAFAMLSAVDYWLYLKLASQVLAA